MIYICIPVFNRVAYTQNCIKSIRSQSFSEYIIVICDDGSTDGTSDIISAEFPEVIIIKGDGNLWWSGGTNKCIEYALKNASPQDYIFTLNNDTELSTNTLQVLVDFGKDKPDSIIACGNYFNNDKSKLEATAFVERNKWPFSMYHRLLFPWGEDISNIENKICEIDSVSGKGVLIPVKVFHNIGLYQSDKLPQYHGDTEFTRRAKKSGFKIWLNLNAIIYTDQTASGIGQVNSKLSIKEFIKSFSSLKSENHLPSLYHRSKLIYHRKWAIYLLMNILSIKLRFASRYINSFRNKTTD